VTWIPLAGKLKADSTPATKIIATPSGPSTLP